MQQLFAGYLLNAAWQVPVVALCAVIVARFGGLAPGARNRLWLLSLAVAAILPAVSLETVLPRALPSVTRLPPDAVATSAPASAAEAVAGAPAVVHLPPWLTWTMTALFAVVAAAVVARLIVASLAARRLVRRSRPASLPAEVTEALDRLAGAHGRIAPPVRRSPNVRSPAVVGALAPVILIPDDMAAQGDDLRAALLHELAHVLRRDYAVNLACEVLTLPVCWHPALVGIKAGVRRSRELACDAIAARAMASQKTYARCLVSLAETLGVSQSPANTALAVGLFGRSDLEERLMQLMNPKDLEAPVVRAARLCSLGAVGASLLGSAALLHVTPVFAQDTPASVAAPPPAASAPAPPAAARQPQADAGKSAAGGHHRAGMIISKKGVIIRSGQGYSHRWTGSDGQPLTVGDDDPQDPSPAQQREWETAAREAETQAAAAEAMVRSPEFRATIAKAKADAAAAKAVVNSPEFKARIAKARADGEAARAMVNSPEFRAKIAKARADAEAVRAVGNSPEFRARIAKARADGEAARAMVNSPEFQAHMARLRDLGVQIQREVDEPVERDPAPAGPTP